MVRKFYTQRFLEVFDACIAMRICLYVKVFAMRIASFVSILKILKIGVMRNFSRLILRCFQLIGAFYLLQNGMHGRAVGDASK